MKAIKSGWGGLANIGSSKKHDQHQKQRAKWEAHREKDGVKQERVNQKEETKLNAWAVKDNQKIIETTLQGEKKAVSQAKKESKAEIKDIKKGRAEQQETSQIFGGLVFEEVTDGVTGERCQAENDLDELHKYTAGFVDRSRSQAALIHEGQARIDMLNQGLEHANSRSTALNKNMQRYVS